MTSFREVEAAYRIALKSLARRYLELHDEIADLDTMIAAIVDELAPNLVTRNSIGPTGAAQLLLTAGGNPDRMRSEASFAALCGVSPVPASSGMTIRHRLNRGGDRAANSALHIIAIGRLRTDQKTKDYVARRIAEGIPSLMPSVPSSATWPVRCSPSSCSARRRSTPRASPLDKQKGVQGSQFTSMDWAAFLKHHNLEHSMSRRGNCHDYAVAESFFNLLKRERIRRKTYRTREEARQDVFDYIEMFYNPKRKHVRNGMLSPVEFERQQNT